MRSWLSVLITDAESKKVFDIPIAPSLYSLSNKMDNSLLAVRDINHKYIVVECMVFNIHHIHIWFCGQTKNMWFLSLSAIPIDYAVRLRIRGFKSFHDTNHLRGQTKNMWLLNLFTILIIFVGRLRICGF